MTPQRLTNEIPIPLEEIIEFKLKIKIAPFPGLKKALEVLDIDAFLSHDLRTLYVDAQQYYEDNHLNRLAFSYAHEVGHYFIHRTDYQSLKFHNIDQFIEFYLSLDEESLYWYEFQADEFAGQLLVPENLLFRELLKLKPLIVKFMTINRSYDNEVLIQMLAKKLAPIFGVSSKVIEVRIRKHKVLENHEFAFINGQ